MRARPRPDMALATAAAMGIIFGAQGISTALPAIQTALGVSDSRLGLFTAAYMLPGVLFAIPLGYLADRIGRRQVFASMAALYGLAGGAQALVGSYEAMLGLRVLQGVGFAALMPLSITLIGDVYSGHAQLRAQASRQVATTTAEFLVPLIGAALAAWSWKAPLAAQGLILPLGLFALVVLDGRPRHDAARGYARQLGEAVREPGMPAVLTAGFLRYVCRFSVVAYLPVVLVQDRGASLGQSAIVVSTSAGIAALVSLNVVRLLRHVRASRLVLFAIAGIGAALIGFGAAPTWQAALAVAVGFGLADGMLGVLQNAMVTEIAPPRIRGGVLAVSGMSRNAGKLLAPLAMGALIVVVSVPWSFAVMGLVTWASLPALRSLRHMDRLSFAIVSKIQ
jgi:MFS transporter, ACDE family, multidrug resistance protein